MHSNISLSNPALQFVRKDVYNVIYITMYMYHDQYVTSRAKKGLWKYLDIAAPNQTVNQQSGPRVFEKI